MQKKFQLLLASVFILLVLTISFPLDSFAQTAGSGDTTLLVYSNTAWQGTAGTNTSSSSVNGDGNNKSTFNCDLGDTFTVSIQMTGTNGYLVINIIQDGKILNKGVTRTTHGTITLSGKCHVPKFSMSDTAIVSIATDKPVYHRNDQIIVSGTVLPELKSSSVNIKVLNPDGAQIFTDTKSFGFDNVYKDLINVQGSLWKNGNFKLIVECQTSIAEVDFTVEDNAQKGNSMVGAYTIGAAKSQYQIGDPITISGVMAYNTEHLAKITITDQYYNTLDTITITPETRSYAVSLDNAKYQKAGTYHVTLITPDNGGGVAFSSFEITGKNSKIPSWIKNNANWWANGTIGDDEFVKGIQYMIQQGIITIPPTIQGDGSGSIPNWVKKNAGLWGDGQISDDEFVKALQYLISQGVITIRLG